MATPGQRDEPVTRILVLVFLTAMIVRAINILLLPSSPEALLIEDAVIYWDGAKVLLEHGVFGRMGTDGIVPETERAPGYIYFLAGLRWLFSDSLPAILFAQAVLDSLTCALIAVIGAGLSRSLALAGGLLAAFWVNLILHSATILSDSLFVFLITAMLAAGVSFLRSASLASVALAGLSLGLALATRSVAQLLPFLILPATVLIPLHHKRGFGVAAVSAVLFLVLSLMPVSPLVYRNVTQFDTMALSGQTGTHLAGWVVPLVRRAADGTPRDRGAAELGAAIEMQIESERLISADANPYERSAVYRQLALEALGEYPLSAVAKAWFTGAVMNLAMPAILIDNRVRNLPHASFDRTEGDGILRHSINVISGSSPAYVIFVGVGLSAAAVFSLAQLFGFIRLVRLMPLAGFLAALCIGYFLVINGPVASPKYRLPFEPVLILLGGIALVDLFSALGRRPSLRRFGSRG